MEEFLSLLRDARLGLRSEPREVDFAKLFVLGLQHEVLALLYEQIGRFPGFPDDLQAQWKKYAIRINAIQAIKSDRFVRLYQRFLQADLRVLVLKGIVCRSLYPKPDNRPSNDEDLYVRKEDGARAEQIMVEDGFQVANRSAEVTTLLDPASGLSIELHTTLFSEKSQAYGSYQQFFADAFAHLAVHRIMGCDVYSLSHAQHMLFLIMHFVKHFLHGGVGIRQVLDIIMYAERFGPEIDWDHLYAVLDEEHVLTLCENVFAIAVDHLGFDVSRITLPQGIDLAALDYAELLDDIVAAGLFGKSSKEREHSSTITLNAVADGKRSLRKSLFPGVSDLAGRYPYLNAHPWMLPRAWGNRILNYVLDRDQGSAKGAVEIGNRRVAMLRKYGVIQDDQ